MPSLPSNLADPHKDPAALLFDCDGTLLLTADLHFLGISKAVEAQGHLMPRDWYMSLTGLDRRQLFQHYTADFAVELDQPRLVADSIALTVTLADQARENPLVADLARAAFGAMPIAVVTNSEAAIARAFLTETALHDLFDAIVTVDDAPRPKPAPDLYLLAAQRLGVTAKDCLVLEDSDQGIESAKAAGMAWLDVRTPEWPNQCLKLRHRLATCVSDGAR